MKSHSFLLWLYLIFSQCSDGIYRQIYRKRIRIGKEDPFRISERFGHSQAVRPSNKLIWFHAASLGESKAILEVVRRLLKHRPELSVLITSTTVNSAEMLARTLPEGAFHQFSPIDTRKAVRRFLNHWHPDIAIWTESELWPRLLLETSKRNIPMLLINARVSLKTSERWQNWPRTARGLLSPFSKVLVQDEKMADLMQKLEVEKSRWLVSGSLKEDLPSLPVDMSALSTLRSLIGTRHCWTGASTHDGEETILADAHKAIREKTGLDSLLILVPRHPERGDHIAESLRQKGWSVALRSRQEAPDQNVQIYIADTLGEMGIWYRLCPVSFIGGALSPIGGHNPYEPALLESAIIHGPHVFNFSEIYQRLHLAGGCLQAATPQGIAIAVVDLLDDEYRKSVIQNAAQALKQDGSATETTLRAILNLID